MDKKNTRRVSLAEVLFLQAKSEKKDPTHMVGGEEELVICPSGVSHNIGHGVAVNQLQTCCHH